MKKLIAAILCYLCGTLICCQPADAGILHRLHVIGKKVVKAPVYMYATAKVCTLVCLGSVYGLVMYEGEDGN